MNTIENNKPSRSFQSILPQIKISPIKAAVISAALTTLLLGAVSVIVETVTGTSLVAGAAFLLSTAAAFLIAHPIIITIAISVLILTIPLIISILCFRAEPLNIQPHIDDTLQKTEFRIMLESKDVKCIIPTLQQHSATLPNYLTEAIREKIESELENKGELSPYTEAWVLAAIKLHPEQKTKILPETTNHPLLDVLAKERDGFYTETIWKQIYTDIDQLGNEASRYAQKVAASLLNRTGIKIPELPKSSTA